MIIDRGHDFPSPMQNALDSYGHDMWLFRDHQERVTTKAVNIYRGEFRESAFNANKAAMKAFNDISRFVIVLLTSHPGYV